VGRDHGPPLLVGGDCGRMKVQSSVVMGGKVMWVFLTVLYLLFWVLCYFCMSLWWDIIYIYLFGCLENTFSVATCIGWGSLLPSSIFHLPSSLFFFFFRVFLNQGLLIALYFSSDPDQIIYV